MGYFQGFCEIEIIQPFNVKNPNEACICELPTGDVLINMRNTTNINRRALAKSINGSWRWSKPEYNEEGIFKGMTGCVLEPYAINGKWAILFDNVGENADESVEILVSQKDFKVIA